MDISALSSFLCVSIGSDRADISHLTLELAQFMRLLAKYDSNNNTGCFTHKECYKVRWNMHDQSPFFLLPLSFLLLGEPSLTRHIQVSKTFLPLLLLLLKRPKENHNPEATSSTRLLIFLRCFIVQREMIMVKS